MGDRAKKFVALPPGGGEGYELGKYHKDYLLQGMRFAIPPEEYMNAMDPTETRGIYSVSNPQPSLNPLQR